jgi:hypothetical protein
MDRQDIERKMGTGVLLSNRNKKSASSPDWRGELKVSEHYAPGDTIKLAAWTKDTKGGALISIKEDTWVPPESTGPGNVNPFPSKRKDDSDLPF